MVYFHFVIIEHCLKKRVEIFNNKKGGQVLSSLCLFYTSDLSNQIKISITNLIMRQTGLSEFPAFVMLCWAVFIKCTSDNISIFRYLLSWVAGIIHVPKSSLKREKLEFEMYWRKIIHHWWMTWKLKEERGIDHRSV